MSRAIATGVVANKNPLVFTDCYATHSANFDEKVHKPQNKS